MRTKREEIAIEACDPEVTRSIMTGHARLGTRPRWERIAHMLACNLDMAHAAISGAPVYDYEAQEWIKEDAGVTLGLDSILGGGDGDSILGGDGDSILGGDGDQ